MMLKPAEWGETMAGRRRGAETMMAFRGWQAEVFANGKIDQARQQQLSRLVKREGLELRNVEDLAAEAADVFEAVFRLLPRSILRAGRQYLRAFVLNSHRIEAARISAYKKGKVCLYPFVVKNYWNLAPLMLHETGHSTGARVQGNSTRGVAPDHNIPAEVRQEFLSALSTIRPTLDRFVVDYTYERQLRLSYISSPNELIADLHVMYVFNGSAIRSYIAQVSDSSSVQAWRSVYSFMKNYVFGGREYVA